MLMSIGYGQMCPATPRLALSRFFSEWAGVFSFSIVLKFHSSWVDRDLLKGAGSSLIIFLYFAVSEVYLKPCQTSVNEFFVYNS